MIGYNRFLDSFFGLKSKERKTERNKPMLDNATAKKVLRMFTYGMYIVTTSDGEDVGAFTADWVMQVSFEPRLLALAVEQDAHSLGVIRKSGVFAVNVLETGQRELAGQFGRATAKVG